MRWCLQPSRNRSFPVAHPNVLQPDGVPPAQRQECGHQECWKTNNSAGRLCSSHEEPSIVPPVIHSLRSVLILTPSLSQTTTPSTSLFEHTCDFSQCTLQTRASLLRRRWKSLLSPGAGLSDTDPRILTGGICWALPRRGHLCAFSFV